MSVFDHRLSGGYLVETLGAKIMRHDENHPSIRFSRVGADVVTFHLFTQP